jgi:glyoxylase-like metal-dependent hydrolase (beta-lactamase superfamily II)
VLLTHGHYDHVGGVAALRSRYEDIPVYLHAGDTNLSRELSMGLQWTHHYEEGDVLTMDGISFRVLHTPGHTPGSVCLLCETSIFSGDTLFQGSCGRTDLPGGNWATITQSLKRLAALEGNFWIFSGHGGSTTLRDEKKYNPYMR